MSAPLPLLLPVYTPELPKKFHGFGVYGIRRAREEDVTREPFEKIAAGRPAQRKTRSNLSRRAGERPGYWTVMRTCRLEGAVLLGYAGLKAGATRIEPYSLNFLLGVACFWFWSSRMSARVSEEPRSQWAKKSPRAMST